MARVPIIGSRWTGAEAVGDAVPGRSGDSSLRRHGPRPAFLGGAVILAVIALAACGRDRSSDETLLPTTSPSVSAAASAGPWDSSEASAGSSGAALPTPTPIPTQDPLASALDAINQLINDINNSLANSDGGGE
jgi:hypothetical protein